MGKSFSIFFYALFSICFFSCGLEEYYVMDAPNLALHIPTKDSNYDERYFDFATREDTPTMQSYLSSSSSFKFIGTAIYYKIYNNYSAMNSVISSIDTLNSSDNASSSAISLIENHKYQQLGLKEGTVEPLIPATGSNRRIRIRLSTYGSNPDFEARINYLDAYNTFIGTPRRRGNRYSFEFGRRSSDYNDYDNNVIPESTDTDVKFDTSASEEHKWYIDLYAVAVGRDSTYVTHYSSALHLGSVAIDDSALDN